MEEIKAILKSWQDKGVPLYFVRDNNKPSVSLTLVVLSSTFIMVGLIGKAAGILGGIDMESALYWNGMSLAVYAQRKYSKKDGFTDFAEKSENLEK